jgi:hypothetical protein
VKIEDLHRLITGSIPWSPLLLYLLLLFIVDSQSSWDGLRNCSEIEYKKYNPPYCFYRFVSLWKQRVFR